ncbi:hypothetical protein L1987_75802 [Smallanthus sonchifolius]|uniref:Uncharacterized protein n=1 Tax=Smallanthus sonchifolius TaxID=185202 RepID=A0ACB9A6Z9_9ASTR|nr:hypothetical protein L1987_75802 [Smallanthus sonchifolius]
MTCETNRFGDDLQLIDFSEEDDYLIAFPYRDSLEDLRLSVTFDNVNGRINHVQSESVNPRRQSFLRKSLAWDSAFFNSAGVLNHEELFMINKGFKKAESNQPSPRTQKDGKRSKAAINNVGTTCSQSNALSCNKMNICSQNKVKSVRALKGQSPNLQGTNGVTKTKITVHQSIQDKLSSLPKLFSSRQTCNNAAVEGSDNVKMENKTTKAATAQDLTVPKRSRSGDLSGLPKSTSFTSPTTDYKSTVYRSYESSSTASSSKNLSKSIKRKVNPKNMKLVNSPSSVHFPLSSTCSSSTSPASSIDGWLSESVSLTTINHQNTIPVLDFHSQNSEERKFISQSVTRSSIGTGPFSGGPRRKLKASGLRMPSPKIGFFDVDPVFDRSMQDRFGGPNPSPNEQELNKFSSSNLSPCVSTGNCLKVGRKASSSCSKLRPDGQTPKGILKMNPDRKRQKDDRGSFEAEKENVCSFEDQVNGLSRQLEVIDLERDVEEVKGQLSVIATATEHSTPCSRTPLGKKKFDK